MFNTTKKEQINDKIYANSTLLEKEFKQLIKEAENNENTSSLKNEEVTHVISSQKQTEILIGTSHGRILILNTSDFKVIYNF